MNYMGQNELYNILSEFCLWNRLPNVLSYKNSLFACLPYLLQSSPAFTYVRLVMQLNFKKAQKNEMNSKIIYWILH